MRRRLAAATLLLGALLLHLGVAAPARRQRDEARGEFARLRGEREGLRAQAARLEARAAAAARAPAGGAAAARSLRASLLRATLDLPLGSVRIGADAPPRGSMAARGQLAAVGQQAALLRLAGRLADPASGVVLETVRLRELRDGEVRLDVDLYTERAFSDVTNARGGGSGS